MSGQPVKAVRVDLRHQGPAIDPATWLAGIVAICGCLSG
jgi:septal ring factor EnvC (AmiA/AmiB activator)